MTRAPFQVLVFPFRRCNQSIIEYAIFQRADVPDTWQGIAGGGDDSETPLQAAQRETAEEAGLSPHTHFIELASVASIPAPEIGGFLWGNEVLVIPEYSFAADATGQTIVLSEEHAAYRWLPFEAARNLLRWDSNKVALWELHTRLTGGT
ncbi:MAG TPA: NUDIX pyrophosphatase [bacterium]|nr:NUDIX pyrophosphatase [bacterium]HQQ01288.1 NUDIX pyrophosphatase [bacterium]